MFHIGRCGSTVLGNMLNAHSKVFWGNEIFAKFMRNEKKEIKKGFVEHTIEQSRQSRVSLIYGFETKYLPQQQLSHKCINMDLKDYIALLRKLNFRKFIVIHRKNYLRRAISAKVGMQTKKWHSRREVTFPEKISIDMNSFTTGVIQEPILELFRCIDENYKRLNALLSHDDTMYLTYENDILKDPRVAYKKTCDFFGIKDESPKINFYRTNPFRYEDIVINFGEVANILKGTKYSWMLDD